MAVFAIWATATLVIKWEASQKQLLQIKHEAEQEKVKVKEEIYLATMHGSLHITNNLLNQLKLVQLEIENHKDFDKEIITLFDGMMLETSSLLTKLSSVKDIEVDKIVESISPK